MSVENSNDNGDLSSQFAGDANGQAAMLLVESLMHGLIARDVISVADAVEIVDVAAEVKADQWADPSDPPPSFRKPLELLAAISTSLRRDISER